MDVPYPYRKLKRGPQVVLPKDIGIILAYTGIGKHSLCIDAGTGSGWLAIALARVADTVISYDTREDFIKIAEANRKQEGLDNLILKQGDVTEKIDEENADLVTLDMADSDKAVKNAYNALKPNGFICAYLPHMEQVKKFVEALSKYSIAEPPHVVEVIVREMLVREAGMRPATKGLLHTAYLIFAQKLSKNKK